MKNSKMVFNYNGKEKEITLITEDEYNDLKDLSGEDQIKKLAANLQSRLDQAFGKDNVKAEATKIKNSDGTESGKYVLSFDTLGDTSTVSVKSNDSDLLRGMGLEYGASNKVNLSGKLDQDALGIDNIDNYVQADGSLNLEINGVKITGLTKNSSISDILSKINSNKEAGVKATYVDATGEFMLVSSETGKGRQIDLGDDNSLAQKLFGNEKDANGGFKEGQNAIVYVSYGNGVDVGLERSSNTFNLEGLNITVSGTFGMKNADALGDSVDADRADFDLSQTVTFTAKADVDGVTEKVKSFFEDFNALVTEISSQVRTRPDSSYGPLTDEQKAEMDETSIENWEKKAKQGLLYGDSAMRDLSADVETIFTKLMMDGASYEDLKEIGITYSEDYLDGGTLVFDESKFRDAMENDPDKVANIFTGGGGVGKGLVNVIDETFTPYATRYASKNGNSYGRLIEIAGSEKKPTTLMENEIYKQLKEMEDTIASLQDRLKVEQDRYISQFTTMESLINQMNTQQSYLSQITG
jgi:flagellar hook-associated protein 2